MRVNHVYRLWDEPPIYYSIGAKHWGELGRHTGDAYLLSHPMWAFGLASARLYRRTRKTLRKQGIRQILLHNSPRDLRLARASGLRGVLLNQNLAVSEHEFRITDTPRVHDAVYIAQAKPFKRIHLAAQIERLYVVTYFWPDVRDADGNWDLHAFEPRVRHAEFNRDRLDGDEVSAVLNRSRVGLALSAREGAMFASVEYLLSGLPIVSTPSVGGRDAYFDPAYVEVVPPRASAVREAVERLIARDLDPHWIRAQTLARMERARRQLYDLCRQLGPGGDTPSYEDFRDRLPGQPGADERRLF